MRMSDPPIILATDGISLKITNDQIEAKTVSRISAIEASGAVI